MGDDESILIDLTEPEPMELREGNIATAYEWEQDHYMWRVELYLVSRYMPEFAESSVWKLYSAAKERAKIVKESHAVHMDLRDLGNAIISDLNQHVPWVPQHSSHKRTYASTPGIGKGYQKQLEEL
jgi:hypothetical protein